MTFRRSGRRRRSGGEAALRLPSADGSAGRAGVYGACAGHRPYVRRLPQGVSPALAPGRFRCRSLYAPGTCPSFERPDSSSPAPLATPLRPGAPLRSAAHARSATRPCRPSRRASARPARPIRSLSKSSCSERCWVRSSPNRAGRNCSTSLSVAASARSPSARRATRRKVLPSRPISTRSRSIRPRRWPSRSPSTSSSSTCARSATSNASSGGLRRRAASRSRDLRIR